MQQRPPQIPARLSSKKDEIESQKRQLEVEIESMNKRIKKHHSFDTNIWTNLKEVESVRIKANGLQRKISILSMNLNDEDEASVERWASTAEAKAILEKEVALNRCLQMMTRQSEKVANQPKDKGFNIRQTWTQLFINSKLGLGVTKASHSRSSERQKQFRAELIEVMNSQHPSKSLEEYFWCPVTRDWCKLGIAGHLFPSKSGDELMKVIFGEPEQDIWIGKPEKGQSELFRACNGILWSGGVEERFTKGLFTIVPDLDENPTPAQSEAWQRSNPKEYRVRVLRPEAPEMQRQIKPESNRRWVDFDNTRLQWRSDFRPRARYLYWSYCEIMLRQAYLAASNTNAAEVHRQEVGKQYWGSAGSYMKKNMLMGFVEEMGHEYEHLMEGAMETDDDDGEEPSQVAVMQANESILEKQAVAERKASGADMDSEDSDDEEDSGMEE